MGDANAPLFPVGTLRVFTASFLTCSELIFCTLVFLNFLHAASLALVSQVCPPTATPSKVLADPHLPDLS